MAWIALFSFLSWRETLPVRMDRLLLQRYLPPASHSSIHRRVFSVPIPWANAKWNPRLSPRPQAHHEFHKLEYQPHAINSNLLMSRQRLVLFAVLLLLCINSVSLQPRDAPRLELKRKRRARFVRFLFEDLLLLKKRATSGFAQNKRKIIFLIWNPKHNLPKPHVYLFGSSLLVSFFNRRAQTTHTKRRLAFASRGREQVSCSSVFASLFDFSFF